MRLNSDCVRDVLLAIEKYQSPNTSIELSYLAKTPELAKYSKDDLKFTLQALENAKFVELSFDYSGETYIEQITWKGYEFLDSIRSPKIWRKIKKTVNSVGTVSLPVLINLASKAAEKFLGM